MTEHKLSEQEIQQIREEAEYNYHIVSEDMFDDTFMDYDDYVKERQKLQRTYIAALTRERERVKGLEEWKRQQLLVLEKLDLQAIGKELEIGLGEDISIRVLP